jgi:hypothetical protein
MRSGFAIVVAVKPKCKSNGSGQECPLHTLR